MWVCINFCVCCIVDGWDIISVNHLGDVTSASGNKLCMKFNLPLLVRVKVKLPMTKDNLLNLPTGTRSNSILNLPVGGILSECTV